MALAAELECTTPDFILSDSSLPDFDGLSALTLVKHKTPKVPFSFCSGHVSEQKKTEAQQHGAIDYVSKNDLAGLISLIKSLAAIPAVTKKSPISFEPVH